MKFPKKIPYYGKQNTHDDAGNAISSSQSMLRARLVSAPLQQAQVRLHKRITAHRPHGFTRCTLAANCSIKRHLH